MDFIEHDLVRMADAPEPGDKGQGGDDGEDSFVVAIGAGGGSGGGSGFDELVQLDVVRDALLGLLGYGGDIALAQRALGRR